MRRTKQVTLLAAVLFVALAAYGQEVHYNYDRSADFGRYRTYQWIEIPGGAVPDPLIDRDIRRAADEQLARKGLTKVENDAALCVGYQFVLHLEESVSLTGTGGGPWGPWGGFQSAQGRTSTIPVGILLIDLYDAGSRNLVWRADATRTIELKKDPEKNYKRLQKSMAKIFENYPPESR